MRILKAIGKGVDPESEKALARAPNDRNGR